MQEQYTPTHGTAAGDVAADARTRGEGGQGFLPWSSPRETRRGRHPAPSSRPGQQGVDGPGGGAVKNRFQSAHNQFLKGNSVHCENSGSGGGDGATADQRWAN